MKKNFEKIFFFFFSFLKFFFSNFHIIRNSGFSLRYAKVRLSFPKKYNWKASFDIHLKWLLGADLKILFTFSNPSLKSALWTPCLLASTLQSENTIYIRTESYSCLLSALFIYFCELNWFMGRLDKTPCNAPHTQFLPRPAREELNAPKLKSS